MTTQWLDVLVIGAGQAGLAIGQALQETTRKSLLIVDAGKRIGDVWRKRYDSLTLFTPRSISALPGLRMEGDPTGFPTKDEVADYLEEYAFAFRLPVQLETSVLKLERDGERFQVTTNRGKIYAREVVVATGACHQPWVPPFALQLGSEVRQLHSSQYRNSDQLADGPVLVVGAGNSGAQIAVEVAQAGRHPVTVSVGHEMKFTPYTFLGRGTVWWLHKVGLLHASSDSKVGRWYRKQPDPVFGNELRDLIRVGTIGLKPRAIGAEENILHFADGSLGPVGTVIWATGFRPDFYWIDIPGALTADGWPVHAEGASPVPGLFYLGQPWQRARASSLILGAGLDAQQVAAAVGTRG